MHELDDLPLVTKVMDEQVRDIEEPELIRTTSQLPDFSVRIFGHAGQGEHAPANDSWSPEISQSDHASGIIGALSVIRMHPRVAGRTSQRERRKVEMLFAHLKRILKLDRPRLLRPNWPGTSSTSPRRSRTSGSSPG